MRLIPLHLPGMTNYLDPIPDTIASIREHPIGVEPTLQSIPQLHYITEREPYGTMIHHMQVTEFESWGFVIYRCAYADNAQWDKYLEFFKASIQQELEFNEVSTLLWKYLNWTVVEDQENLNGASKEHVQRRFSQWVDGQRVESGAEWPMIEYLPRFRYCIYVDQNCLNTVDEYETWADAGGEGVRKIVVCAILDKDRKSEGRGNENYQSIEGCTREDTGWMYLSVGFVPAIYNRLSAEELADYDPAYVRPPRVWPERDMIMPFEP